MSSQKEKKPFVHASLPLFESYCYWITWISFLLYTLYVGYDISVKYASRIPDIYFTESWFSTKQDISVYEWTFWKGYKTQLTLIFTFHSMSSKLVLKLYPAKIVEYQLLSSILLIIPIVSLQGFLYLMLNIFCFYVVLTKSRMKILTWIYCGFQLLFLDINSVRSVLYNSTASNLFGDDSYDDILITCNMMCSLRLLSYGSNMVVNDNKKFDSKLGSNQESFNFRNNNQNCTDTKDIKDFLHYVFYLPLFFNGPILTFSMFQKQLKNKCTYSKSVIIKDILSVLLYYFVLEIMLHFVHVPSIAIHQYILEDLSAGESISVNWILLYIFLLEYVVFYRFAGIFVKLDGLIPPGSPKCVFSLYTFTDMWRSFDKGLHNFLQEAVYIPLGGSKKGLFRQICATVMCFSIISYWHGNDVSYWFWGLSSCAGIIVENCVAVVMKSHSGLQFRASISCVMYRRVCAVGGAISIYFLVFTNVVFLTNLDRAEILFKNCFKTWYFHGWLFGILVASTHCSIDIR